MTPSQSRKLKKQRTSKPQAKTTQLLLKNRTSLTSKPHRLKKLKSASTKQSLVKAKQFRLNLPAMGSNDIARGPDSQAVLPYIPPGQIVVGIDEVGRGAWAGPLLVAAVVM